MYGVSLLPIMSAPQLPDRPIKLLRENKAPLTVSLSLEVDCRSPGVDEMSIPASNCQIKSKPASLSGCVPRIPR